MSAPAPTGFAEFFQLAETGSGLFTARLEDHGGLAFGGETFGLATLAAARTCADRPVHSLHMHYMRPVPSSVPVEFVVERTRDGRRIAHRRVEVRREGRLLAQLVASFATPSEGPDFETAAFDPPVVPETLRSEAELAREEGWENWEPGAIEWRWPERPWDVPAGTPSQYQGWARPTTPLRDDKGLRGAALAFLSDYHSHLPVARVLGRGFEPVGFSSLDIVVWLHRDLPWEDFWLATSVADIAHGGRALTRRHVHDRDGRLVATMMQEALIPPE